MKIRDGYISYKNAKGLHDFETLGGFELINGKPKQIPITKFSLRSRKRELVEQGCEVLNVQLRTYEVENNKYAELIDPVKTEQL